MNNVVVFIAPTIDAAIREKLAESLRIRQIATTDDMQNATLVITNIGQPVKQMDIADLAEKLVDACAQKISIVNREILSLNPKKQKPTFATAHPLKKFNQTKQNHRQRFLTRTNCK